MSIPLSLYGTPLYQLSESHFQHCSNCGGELSQQNILLLLPFLFTLIAAIVFKYFTYKSSATSSDIESCQWANIGKIKICKNSRHTHALGHKGNVLKGKFQDTPDSEIEHDCAVKVCMHKQNLSKREMKIFKRLQDSPPNPHIIRYLGMERDIEAKIMYIALELCNGTLKDAIKTTTIHPCLTVHCCLAQITEGVRFLHERDIQHRDIKPDNILWKDDGKNNAVRFIISDFDLCHVTDDRSSSHRIAYGTCGWMALDLLRRRKRTTAVDIFSLGCVFYYVLSLGKHPFSKKAEYDLEKCQQNIYEHKFYLSALDEQYSASAAALAIDLIQEMINHRSSERPDVTSILKHPMFWTKHEIMNYYVHIGNKLRDKHSPAVESLRINLEDEADKVFQGSWRKSLDSTVLKDISTNTFNKNEICALLKVIRNKCVHFSELHEKRQAAYLGSAEGVAEYYNEKFPKLLPYVYRVEQNTY